MTEDMAGRKFVETQTTYGIAAPTPKDDLAVTLMRFYNVTNLLDLVEAQYAHIEKLQAKLPALRDAEPRNPRKG